jgi:general secretion pathway protein D
MLKFLRASNLEPAVTNLNSEYGTIAVDKETNSLIVCDSAGKLAAIVEQIRKADQMPKQILVEVVIVDVQLNDDTEIGVDWEHLSGRGNTEKYTQNLVTTIANVATTTGADFRFIHDGIQAAIHALQTVRNVEILASPRVLVVSGQEALIKTIEEIPYTETTQTSAGGGGASAIASTEFKEAGITLKVKATLTDEGKILIAIEAEQSVNAGIDTSLGSEIPIVDRRNANTTLLMDDGQTVVMGGLRKSEKTITKSKIPLLGDLPLIGVLFSNEKEDIKHSELLIFISPHVYKDEMLTEQEKARFEQVTNLPPIEFPDHPRKEFKALGEASDWLSLEK